MPTGFPVPAARCAPTTYIRLVPERRDFYVYPAHEVEDEDGVVTGDYLTAADLPASVTDGRLREFQELEERAEWAERAFDEARSYLPSVLDPDDDPSEYRLSAKERNLLRAQYEAALEEEKCVYDHEGKAAKEAADAAKAAKESLLNDLFGPVPPTPADTVYLSFHYGYAGPAQSFSAVGTYTELLHTAVSLGEPCDVKWLLRGYLTAADLGLPNSLLQRYTELWDRLSKELSLSIQADIWPVPAPEDDLTPLVTEFNSIRETVMKAYNG